MASTAKKKLTLEELRKIAKVEQRFNGSESVLKTELDESNPKNLKLSLIENFFVSLKDKSVPTNEVKAFKEKNKKIKELKAIIKSYNEVQRTLKIESKLIEAKKKEEKTTSALELGKFWNADNWNQVALELKDKWGKYKEQTGIENDVLLLEGFIKALQLNAKAIEKVKK